jgi:hypothetical protein
MLYLTGKSFVKVWSSTRDVTWLMSVSLREPLLLKTIAQKCPSAKEYSLVKADASVLFNLTFEVFTVVTIFYWGTG